MKISQKFTLGDHLLNSHDIKGLMSIDIKSRNVRLKWLISIVRYSLRGRRIKNIGRARHAYDRETRVTPSLALLAFFFAPF